MSNSFKESDEWLALLSLLRQGLEDKAFQPILWVGAGLSVPAGYPTTSKLIESIQSKSLKPLPDFSPDDTTFPIESINRSFTLWVQNFATINGYGRLSKALSGIFSRLRSEPTSTHLALVTNPWKSVFTTNYDNLLEVAFERKQLSFNLVTYESNYGLEQSDLISLYKIHGSVNNIREWTLDEQSYLGFADKYPFIEAKLKSTLFPHSIVYVGCSMLDPRVIKWYQFCEEKNLSSQLEYSIVIIRKNDWDALPKELIQLYIKSNMHPLFFGDFDELPNLFESINNELSLSKEEASDNEELVKLSIEETRDRELGLLADLLYDKVSPTIIEIIASIWLQVPKNIRYTDYLRTLGGAKTKSKGEIAFKSLLDDFVELCEKLIGSKLEFQYIEKVFLHLEFILSKYFPSYESLERVGFNPHSLFGSLQVFTAEEDSFCDDPSITLVFNNILKECCELIIDCSQALPSWTKENLDSQLNDQKLLFGNLREELERWKENSLNEVDEIVLIEDEYRRAIARRFDELKIFGLTFGKRTRKYQLSVAYISLTTETDSSTSENNTFMSTSEALTCYNKLVILGEAGQGKTTLLQWLIVQCGRRSFENEQAHFNEKVPVLIQLRSILGKGALPEELDFYEFMATGIKIESTHLEWIESILEKKLGIIMIDGFDEVPQEQRKQVLEWIDRLCSRYDGNQFILTSRPSAYENTSLEHLGFNVIQLQTMDRKAQSDFVEHWHNAIALEYDKTKPQALIHEATSLLDKLSQQKVLRNLAQNPLLCGVLCMLHHDRSGYLPKDKTDLYESTCRLFLDSRDREKKVLETDKFTLLDIRNKESFLSDIAFWMTINGKTSISPKDLKYRLESKCKDMPSLWKRVTPDELELFFLERSGLLVQVGINEIQFTHRTFQEFYTAKYIISENDNSVLLSNAGNDYWNGTIQLAVGLRTSKTENEKYLTELLVKANDFEMNQDSNSAISLYLLVLSCQESMREITPHFSGKLKAIIKKVVPPRTAKVRDALASAGDIAVRYLLRPKSRQSIVKDHYSALALIKISTPDAYITLKDYFKDNRDSYIQKLCNDIKKMDPEVIKESNLVEAITEDGIEHYPQPFRTMLAFLMQDSSLIEDSIKLDDLLIYERAWKLSQGIIPFEKLNKSGVTHLELANCHIQDLSFLNDFGELISLNLNWSTIRKFPQLDELKNLKSLELKNTRIIDLDTISELSKLSSLEALIIEGSSFKDITFISNMKCLKRLVINRVNILDLSPLHALLELEEVSFSKCKINDLNFIIRSKKLNVLNLMFVSVNDLSAVSSLHNLKELCLISSYIPNLDFLRQLSSLEKINISACNFQSELINISSLSNLNNLKFISLILLRIKDISALASLENVEELNLSGNLIDNIQSLKNFSTLKKLNLMKNQINDIRALRKLSSLKELDLSKNEIVNISPLKSLNNLNMLDISSNNINDITALKNITTLITLDLGNNDINNVASISDLVNIEALTISNTKVTTLNGLEKLVKLEYIELHGLVDGGVNVTPILNHPSLRFVKVGFRNVKKYAKLDFKSKPYIF